jgi:lipopolysaccharide/colanic/teichoic acid biosynthesis glycosyltransferase
MNKSFILKRAMDIIGSLVGLIILFPISETERLKLLNYRG